MSRLDRLKETIAYLKVWLGVFVLTDISLAGWFAIHYNHAEKLLLILASFVILAVAGGVILLHRNIEAKIKLLEDL